MDIGGLVAQKPLSRNQLLAVGSSMPVQEPRIVIECTLASEHRALNHDLERGE